MHIDIISLKDHILYVLGCNIFRHEEDLYEIFFAIQAPKSLALFLESFFVLKQIKAYRS